MVPTTFRSRTGLRSRRLIGVEVHGANAASRNVPPDVPGCRLSLSLTHIASLPGSLSHATEQHPGGGERPWRCCPRRGRIVLLDPVAEFQYSGGGAEFRLQCAQ